MDNTRCLYFWLVYDWETRTKEFLMEPPASTELRPSVSIYRIGVNLYRNDPPNEPHSKVVLAREEWDTAPKRPQDMPLDHWIAGAIMRLMPDMVPPGSYGPDKGPIQVMWGTPSIDGKSRMDINRVFVDLPGEKQIILTVSQKPSR